MGIEEQIKEFREKKDREKPLENKGLVRQFIETLKSKASDRTIAKPSLFVRDINRLISYLSHEIEDPLARVIREKLSELSNDILTAVRKSKEFLFKKETQDELLSLFIKLENPKESLNKLNSLFEESYVIRASLSTLLRRIAAVIYQSENAIQR